MNDRITNHDNRFAITADYLLFLLCSFKFSCILNFSQVISSHEIESLLASIYRNCNGISDHLVLINQC